MRSRLRFLVAPVWLLNMIFLFGSISSIFSDENGQLSIRELGVVGLFFVFFMYLFYDIVKFNRPTFLRVIAVILLVSSIYFLFVQNYFMVLPTLVTGILLLRKINVRL